MSAEIITRAELTEYLSRSGIEGLSDGQLDEAIARAVDRIRQAALNWYTAASFESVTAVTAPAEMKIHALALALAAATQGDAARPESIQKSVDDAVRWLGYMAGGKTHYDASPDSVLELLDNGSVVSSRTPGERVFSRSTSSLTATDYDLRNRKI